MKTLPGSDRRIIWVPARQSLKHAPFSVPSQLSGRKRASALELIINAWSPFSDPAFAISWEGSNASVYTWDRKTANANIEANGFDPSNCEVVPEAFIREPISDGVRLVNSVHGFEGQIWNAGLLRLTRWWSAVPNQRDWTMFFRSAGFGALDFDNQVPTPSEPEWLDVPWNARISNSSIFLQVLIDRRYVAAIFTVLIAPCAFFAAKWFALSLMVSGIQQDVIGLERLGQTTREERNHALSSLEVTEDLLSLRKYPHHIEIVSRSHNLLTAFAVTISGWDFDQGILEFGLESETDMDATLFIPIFENDIMFDRVSASTLGARLMMRMNVATTSELQQ